MPVDRAPNPLPFGFGPEGLDSVIQATYHCESRWLEAYDVLVPAPTSTIWIGFVHEFELVDYPPAERCFVIRDRMIAGVPGEVHVFLKDNRMVKDPEDAARWLVAAKADCEREERVSTS